MPLPESDPTFHRLVLTTSPHGHSCIASCCRLRPPIHIHPLSSPVALPRAHSRVRGPESHLTHTHSSLSVYLPVSPSPPPPPSPCQKHCVCVTSDRWQKRPTKPTEPTHNAQAGHSTSSILAFAPPGINARYALVGRPALISIDGHRFPRATCQKAYRSRHIPPTTFDIVTPSSRRLTCLRKLHLSHTPRHGT
jgi:hypothetical protein